MSFEWAFAPKPTKADRKAWASLNRKYPGINVETERFALRMAAQSAGRAKSSIRYTRTEAGFMAHVEVFSLAPDKHCHPVSFPVIPDEFNPDNDKQITPDMPPHLFEDEESCIKAAEGAEEVLLREVRQIENEARRTS